jgi:hypothetical protein
MGDKPEKMEMRLLLRWADRAERDEILAKKETNRPNRSPGPGEFIHRVEREHGGRRERERGESHSCGYEWETLVSSAAAERDEREARATTAATSETLASLGRLREARVGTAATEESETLASLGRLKSGQAGQRTNKLAFPFSQATKYFWAHLSQAPGLGQATKHIHTVWNGPGRGLSQATKHILSDYRLKYSSKHNHINLTITLCIE